MSWKDIIKQNPNPFDKRTPEQVTEGNKRKEINDKQKNDTFAEAKRLAKEKNVPVYVYYDPSKIAPNSTNPLYRMRFKSENYSRYNEQGRGVGSRDGTEVQVTTNGDIRKPKEYMNEIKSTKAHNLND
jgi:hypothetical protein